MDQPARDIEANEVRGNKYSLKEPFSHVMMDFSHEGTMPFNPEIEYRGRFPMQGENHCPCNFEKKKVCASH